MARNDWRPVQICCLNCATKLTGYKNSEGKVKFVCPRCRIVMISQSKGKTGTVEYKLP